MPNGIVNPNDQILNPKQTKMNKFQITKNISVTALTFGFRFWKLFRI